MFLPTSWPFLFSNWRIDGTIQPSFINLTYVYSMYLRGLDSSAAVKMPTEWPNKDQILKVARQMENNIPDNKIVQKT